MIQEFVAGRLWLLLLMQGTACVAAGLVASYVLRHRPARAHQVLLTALLAAVLMPTLYLSVGRLGLGLLAPPALPKIAETSVSDTFRAVPVSEDGPAIEAADDTGPWPVDPIVAPVSPYRRAALRVPWNTIVIACWSVATALLLLRLVLRFLLGWRVVRTAQPVDSEPIRRSLDAAKGKLGVDKPIRIRRSRSVRSPVIWCWSREPVLLVQEDAPDAGSRADWMGVFCHEVSHWRRLDHLTGLFTEVLRTAFPWHPLLWWTKSRLLKLSEQACDDWVLATGQNGVDYAEILLSLAAERQMAFLPTVIGKEKTMHTRIRRIIKDSGSDPRLGTGWALAVGVLALCTTVGVAVAQRRPAGPEPMNPPPAKVSKERREIKVGESPEVEQQRIATKCVLERLTQQAEEKKEMLREGNDLPEEERLAQQIELKLLVEQIEQLKNRLEAPGRAPVKVAPKKLSEPDFGARVDSLRQGHKELGLSAEKMERELDEAVRGGRDQEVRELKSHLEKIRQKRTAIERELDELKGRKLDEPKLAQVEKREKVLRKTPGEEQDREKLPQDLRLRAEKLARALKEDPGMDPEKAADLRKELEATRAKLGVVEQESRGPRVKKEAVAPKREYRILKDEVKIEKKAPDGPPPRAIKGPAADRVPATEVEALRSQMRVLTEQMQQIQSRLDRMAEQERTDRSKGPADRPQEYRLEY
jgi:beta-lactamase regulating signal transducer with metallopeptidase domain